MRNETYFAFEQAGYLQLEGMGRTDNISNIAVKTKDMKEFFGDCWPGKAIWIDYLNSNARKFWSSLYDTKVFNGTNYLYGMWIDMNEPAIFHSMDLRMPPTNLHIKSDGTIIEHYKIHNLYGLYM